MKNRSLRNEIRLRLFPLTGCSFPHASKSVPGTSAPRVSSSFASL